MASFPLNSLPRPQAEEEKKQKDATIRSLNDDLAAQDDVIAKLSKEKANLDEEHSKTLDTLAQEEEKVNHLSKVKAKLEASVDEVSSQWILSLKSLITIN